MYQWCICQVNKMHRIIEFRPIKSTNQTKSCILIAYNRKHHKVILTNQQDWNTTNEHKCVNLCDTVIIVAFSISIQMNKINDTLNCNEVYGGCCYSHQIETRQDKWLLRQHHYRDFNQLIEAKFWLKSWEFWSFFILLENPNYF